MDTGNRNTNKPVLLQNSPLKLLNDQGLNVEQADAQTLNAMLSKQGCFDPVVSLSICWQIANCLQNTHRQGTIHGEVTPSNVTIVVQERFDVRLINSDHSNLCARHNQFRDWATYEAVAYFSPEQIFAEPITVQSDIYQLGLILYECLYGRLPFEANLDKAIAFRSANPNWAKQRTCARLFRPELELVLNKMLARNPEDRFADMQAVVARLAGLIENYANVGHSMLQTSWQQDDWRGCSGQAIINVQARAVEDHPGAYDQRTIRLRNKLARILASLDWQRFAAFTARD